MYSTFVKLHGRDPENRPSYSMFLKTVFKTLYARPLLHTANVLAITSIVQTFVCIAIFVW